MTRVQKVTWPAGMLTLLSTGCMRPAGTIFPRIDPPLNWPLPPLPPRIRYVGEIRGLEDLKPPRSGWQALRKALGDNDDRRKRFSTPGAVAVGSDGRVYVVDTGSAALHVLDLRRRTHRVINEAGADRLRSPVGVTVGSNGVYITDAVLGAVFEFDGDGRFVRRLDVHLQRPGGIAYCSENERLYVLDTAAHHCVVIDSDGNAIETFGQRGSEPGKFNFPTHVTCHPLLGVLISDTLNFRIQRFDLDGTLVSVMGKKGDGAGDFSMPKGVAADSDGHIYVVDAHFENVQIFRPDGRLLLAFGEEGNGAGQFSIPGGIAIDAQDRIWVADAHNRRLAVLQYLGQRKP